MLGSPESNVRLPAGASGLYTARKVAWYDAHPFAGGDVDLTATSVVIKLGWAGVVGPADPCFRGVVVRRNDQEACTLGVQS